MKCFLFTLCVYICVITAELNDFQSTADSQKWNANVAQYRNPEILSWSQKWHDGSHSSSMPGTNSPLFSNPSIVWEIDDISLVPIFASDSNDQAIIGPDEALYYVRDQQFLHAVYFNGTLKWESTLPGSGSFGSNPALDVARNIIYEYSSNDVGLCLYAFDASNGNLLWTYPGDKPLQTWVPMGSPVVTTGGVVLSAYSEYGNGAYVFFINGTNTPFPYPYPNFVKWAYSLPGTQIPTVPSVGPNGTVYVAFNHLPSNVTTIVALSSESGELLWTQEFEVEYPLVSMRLTGIRADGTVVVLHSYDTTKETILISPDGQDVQHLPYVQVYVMLPDNKMIVSHGLPPRPQVQLVHANGSVIWTFQMHLGYDVTGVAMDGGNVVYMSVEADPIPGAVSLYALNGVTGEELWRQELGADEIANPAIAPDGSVFVRTSVAPPVASHKLIRITCCSDHGYCDPSGRCDCESNWHGDTCSYFCNDTKCYFENNLHGRCNYFGECVCTDNYYPLGVCNMFCNNTACFYGKNGHAACTSEGKCECSPNYYGDLCDISCDANKNCSGNGKCNSQGTCECFVGSNFLFWKIGGYTGATCSEAKTPWALIGFFAVILVLLIAVIVTLFVLVIKKRLFKMYLHTQYEAID